MSDVRWLKSAALIAALAMVLVACGEDPENNDGGLSNSFDASNSNNSNGGSDADTGPEPDAGNDADGGNENDTGNGEDTEEGNHCGEPTDLGELATDETHTFESSLIEPAGSLDTSCEQEDVGDRVRVFSFEPEVSSRLSIWSTVEPSQYDLREGDCEDPDEVLSCTTRGTEGADVEGGQTYHLVVWGDITQEDFELELDLEEAICEADEEPWCEPDDEQLQECDGGTDIETSDCIEDCADESSCRADTCDAPVEVDLSSSSQASVTGELGAYTDTWNASDLADGECAFEGSSSNVDSPESEVFFEVSGLTAGQTLTVESMGSGDYYFFVLDACGDDNCLAAVDDDDQGEQRLSWEVPEDGTYTVVIEPSSGRDRDFQFDFAVE